MLEVRLRGDARGWKPMTFESMGRVSAEDERVIKSMNRVVAVSLSLPPPPSVQACIFGPQSPLCTHAYIYKYMCIYVWTFVYIYICTHKDVHVMQYAT